MQLLDKNNITSLTNYNKLTHVDFIKLKRSGLNIQFFAAFIDAKNNKKMYNSIYNMIIRFIEDVSKTQDIEIAKTVKDVKTNLKEKKITAILSIEGGEALEENLGNLFKFYELGVRSLGLTWNWQNELGTGVMSSNKDIGLSSFGKKVVHEMNNLGMIIDLSHLGKKSFVDAINISSKPLLVSHANAYKICNHPRNLTDEQIKLIAQNDGVIGLTYYPQFVKEDSQLCNIEDLLDHFCYIAYLVGIEHIGYGSDYDGIDKTVVGLEDITCLHRLIKGLKKRGFSDEEIAKISGKNFYNLISKVIQEAQ